MAQKAYLTANKLYLEAVFWLIFSGIACGHATLATWY